MIDGIRLFGFVMSIDKTLCYDGLVHYLSSFPHYKNRRSGRVIDREVIVIDLLH